MRSLLRGFLSPPIADRVAAGLEPVAVADRRAALGAAAELLQQRFHVTTEALAAALVRDAGQDVESTAVTLGVDSSVVLAAVSAEDLAPGASPPATAPERSSTPASPPSASPPPAPIDVTAGRVPRPAAEPKRRQPVAIALGIAVGLVLVAAVVLATMDRDPADDTVAAPTTTDAEQTEPDDAASATVPPADGSGPDDEPAATASPTDEPASSATDEPAIQEPTALSELRFVTEVDVVTGEAAAAQATVTADADVLAWVALAPQPAAPTVVELTFEGPDGSRTVRPALVAAGNRAVAVRLPQELGRAPGRYVVIAELRGADADPLRAEVQIEAG